MNAREAARRVLDKVASGGYADALLASLLDRLAPIDRPLATEITYGTLRHMARLDYIIDTFSTIKTGKLEHTVLNALRIGVYQLYLLDNIPASAAINESVNLVKHNGQKKAGFVNAVLRKADAMRDSVIFPSMEQDPLRHLAVYYSLPQWLAARWIARFGVVETAELCTANLAPPPRTLRVNALKTQRTTLLEEFALLGVRAATTPFSPDGIGISSGTLEPEDARWYFQDEGSQLIARLLAPQPGETIIDACAAPGGKTTHLAALMKNSGRIYALDKDARRLRLVEEAAARLGVGIIIAKEADASEAALSKTLPNAVDAVLCDAPCSGLGVIRRTPDIKWRRTLDDVKELAARQGRLLDNLARFVKPGGRIVYSVCSFEPEETDGVIDVFMKTQGNFTVEDAAGILPLECAPLVDGSGLLRTYPHRHGMDGFFAARLKRAG